MHRPGGAMRDFGSKVFIAIIVVMVLASLFAPLLAPYGEAELVGPTWAGPSRQFWFGTDELGRDLFSRLLYGGRITIGIALIATAISFVIGVAAGFWAAAGGRWADPILSRIVDVLMSLPPLVIALLVVSALGSSIPLLIAVIVVIDATRVFRLSRAVAQNIAAMDFIEVATLRGETTLRIMWTEILPNALPLLSVEFALRFGFAILTISSLSFLGLGVQPPFADWGSMVRENAMGINFGGTAALFPAAAIAVLTLSLNLLVDSLSSKPRHG